MSGIDLSVTFVRGRRKLSTTRTNNNATYVLFLKQIDYVAMMTYYWFSVNTRENNVNMPHIDVDMQDIYVNMQHILIIIIISLGFFSRWQRSEDGRAKFKI